MAVDSSQPALDEAEINAARNNLDGLTEFVRDDALKFMKVRLRFPECTHTGTEIWRGGPRSRPGVS